MEKYEQITVVGEGSYGVVMKCKHRDTDQLVAIKKYLETEEDANIRRMALREIRMLKRLRHENLVTMIEVFRHRKRFYLVFEYMEGTVLDELEKYPEGLGDERSRERIYQVTRAIQYCHSKHIIHRDVKPENVLVSSKGVVKLCDFGLARLDGGQGDAYTEYVATRWYRAPELLVRESHYGAPVDIWAIGCLFSEMMTGKPLFPGESDIDQLYLIIKLIGNPCSRHQQLMAKNTHLRAIKRSTAMESNNLYKLFAGWSLLSLDFLSVCLKMDPMYRPTADELLKHKYFLHDRFPDKFLPALRDKVRTEFNENPLLRKFKVDILMSSETRNEKREEIKLRRTIQVEPLKIYTKKIETPILEKNLNSSNLRIQVQKSIKRKFSSDTEESKNINDTRSIISLNRTTQKSMQKLGQYKNSLHAIIQEGKSGNEQNIPKYSNHGLIVPKINTKTSETRNSQKENHILEKAQFPPHWRIQVQESLKRKFSSVTEESKNINDNRSIISLNRTTQKSMRKLGQYKNSLHAIKQEGKSSNEQNIPKYSNHGLIVPKIYTKKSDTHNSQKENPRLEKPPDILSKLNQKNYRPKSIIKDLQKYNNMLPPSLPEFQSWQSQCFRQPAKSPMQHTVLHPNITNNCFTKHPKKSPNLIQNVNNLTLKPVFNQTPKAQHSKRLDRHAVIDTTHLSTEKSARFKSPPDWLSSVGMAQKRDTWKGTTSNELTLPTIPGATGSPHKSRKKPTPEQQSESRIQTSILYKWR